MNILKLILIQLLIPVSAFIWAYGRSSVEAATHEWKNGNKVGFGLQSSFVYHGYTLIETLGLLLFIIPNSYSASYYNRTFLSVVGWLIINSVMFFIFYYLPYSLRYNLIRGNKWFTGKKYNIKILKKDYQIRYINKELAVTLYVLALFFLLLIVWI